MKKTILLMAVCLCFIGKASAQWVVSDPGNLAQGIINTTKQIVQTSTTAKNTLDGFMEAQKIFQQGKKYYDALIIRKTKCFDFWERNVLFPKTKRSFFRTPTPSTLPFSA